ncbi:MAG: hypothetical protein KBD82_17535, partial [Rhodoferax sp.]|nr:hypothetical protein [Rhodoferax sp.]
MSTNGDRKCEGEHIHPRTKVTLNDLAKHGIHRPTHTSDKKSVAKNVVIGASIVGGTASTTVGVIAAGTSATGAISAAGAAIGGLAGGVFGSGVGLAAGGVGCEGEHIHPRTKVTLNDLAKHGIHRLTHTSDKKSVAKNVVIGASIVGGTAATTVGVIAAGTSATGAISAAGAAIGGLAGGVFGSGVGLAAGGV